jgi:hypothetical protein
MQPHEERVVDEKNVLDEKLVKLQNFIEHNKIFQALPNDDKELLERQEVYMSDYSQVLAERIARFKVNV